MWGLLVFFFCLLDGHNFINLIAFLSFYSLWHLLGVVLSEKLRIGLNIHTIFFIFAFVGFSSTIAVKIMFGLSIKSEMGIFMPGIMYVPTYLHLLIEIKRQQVESDRYESILNRN